MIGVLGGYGAVGAYVARFLHAVGMGPLRIGGRNTEAARRRLGDTAPPAQWLTLDAEDRRQLAAFVDGCDMVVNCTGPSHRNATHIAAIVRAAGAHHVDAGGDTRQRLCGLVSEGPVTVFAAGATPGLSGLVPRALTDGWETIHRIVTYSVVLDQFTPAAATDYLTILDDPVVGRPQPWHRTRISLAALPDRVTAIRYEDAETRSVQAALAAADAQWHMALEGEHLLRALDAVRPLPRDEAAARLCSASSLDVAGRLPYAMVLAEVEGLRAGQPTRRSVAIRACGIAALTGAAATAAAMVVAKGGIAGGIHSAALLPAPDAFLAALTSIPGACTVRHGTDRLIGPFDCVEGAI